MGWTSYYVGSKDIKDCVMEEVSRASSKIKKTSRKGNNFYFLMETPKGEDWILLMKTSKSKGEFYYKDIQCNPYESSNVPLSLLKAFKPSNDDDKGWLEKQLKALEETKLNTKKFNIGDIVKCRANYDIEWANNFKVKADTDFFISVERKPFAKNNTKVYRLLWQTTNLNGEPCLRSTNCRLKNKSFDNLKNRETVSDLKKDGYTTVIF